MGTCSLFAAEVVETPVLQASVTRNPGILITQSAADRAINGGPAWVYPSGNVRPITKISMPEDGNVSFFFGNNPSGSDRVSL